MNKFLKGRVLLVILWTVLALAVDQLGSDAEPPPADTASISELEPHVDLPESNIWQRGVGEGFLRSVQTITVESGVAPGITTFGSRQAHDFALLSLSYGRVLSPVIGEGHWYRGNVEGRLELFGGGQFSPSKEWVIGLTPHLRYEFATGSRWIPFFDAGAGVTATGIGSPDLSGTFEFNLQAAVGVHWILSDRLALTGEARYLHLSCAGLHKPNLGANNAAFMIGLTWFFGK